MIIPPASMLAQAQAGSSVYRLKRGTKLSDLPPVSPSSPVPDLSSLNGPFQLAEYLSLKIRHDPHDVKGLVEVPVGDASLGGKAPDKNVWIYEHLRRIPIDLTPLVTALLPLCNSTTCPEMKAEEWLFLCSAHEGGAEQCCAIDYILHTLDSTTALLNSSQNFPSRMQIPQASLSHFPSLFRRLSRIFSHAYFHHREAFSMAEAETSLYARFLALCEKYHLVGESLLPIPKNVVCSDGNGLAERAGEGGDDDAEDREFSRGEKGKSQSSNQHHSSSDETQPKILLKAEANASPEKAGSTNDSSPTKAAASARGGASGLRDLSHVRKGKSIGPGTLGRGKQPRTTMNWASLTASQEGVPSLPQLSDSTLVSTPTAESPVKGRERSESIESAIHIPSLDAETSEASPDQALEDLAAEISSASIGTEAQDQDNVSDLQAEAEGSSDQGVQGEEEEVPKDEIELLEEEGKLKAQSPVFPLAPPSGTEQPRERGEEAAQSVEKPREAKQAEKTETEESKASEETVAGSDKDGKSTREGEEDLEEVDLNQESSSPVGVGRPETQSPSNSQSDVQASVEPKESALVNADPKSSNGVEVQETGQNEVKAKSDKDAEQKEANQATSMADEEKTSPDSKSHSIPSSESALPPTSTDSSSPSTSSSSPLSKVEKKDGGSTNKKLSPLRDKPSPAPSPIKGKGKPSAAEVVKSGSSDVEAGLSNKSVANTATAAVEGLKSPGEGTKDKKNQPAVGATDTIGVEGGKNNSMKVVDGSEASSHPKAEITEAETEKEKEQNDADDKKGTKGEKEESVKGEQ